MPNLKDLFFSFDGRIGRKAWWLGTIVLAAASIAGTLLIDPSVLDYKRQARHLPNWSDTIWQLALIIPGTALMVKRFNDRDRPHWLGYVYGVLGAVLTAGPHFGLFTPGHTNSVETVILVIFTLAFFFAFVDNGFLRGTKGPNDYGPDPFEGSEPTR